MAEFHFGACLSWANRRESLLFQIVQTVDGSMLTAVTTWVAFY